MADEPVVAAPPSAPPAAPPSAPPSAPVTAAPSAASTEEAKRAAALRLSRETLINAVVGAYELEELEGMAAGVAAGGAVGGAAGVAAGVVGVAAGVAAGGVVGVAEGIAAGDAADPALATGMEAYLASSGAPPQLRDVIEATMGGDAAALQEAAGALDVPSEARSGLVDTMGFLGEMMRDEGFIRSMSSTVLQHMASSAQQRNMDGVSQMLTSMQQGMGETGGDGAEPGELSDASAD